MSTASPSTADILRAIDAKISALQIARKALQGAFFEQLASPDAADRDPPPPHRVLKARRGKGVALSLPEALAKVMDGNPATVAQLSDRLQAAMVAGEFRVKSKASNNTIRTTLFRIHEARGWERGHQGETVSYRIKNSAEAAR
jgi:hypothetical protein